MSERERHAYRVMVELQAGSGGGQAVPGSVLSVATAAFHYWGRERERRP
ncbi:MAG: hypothetical protein WD942_02310 [Dehalococcoidia bacterium]